MTTHEQVFGNWNQFKGLVKERWGQLTDDELQEVEGRFDQLIALIQQKTGEARGHIEEVIEELSDQTGGALFAATETARQYAHDAAESMRGAAEHLHDRAAEGYEEAHDFVSRRPAESVAVAFGTGLLVGIVVSLLVRSK